MSIISVLLLTALLSFAPISELRGGIPFAIVNNIPWYLAYPFSVFINILVAPACWIFLATIHKLLYKVHVYKIFFDRIIERARKKLSSGVEKWGWIGIALFVAIPLPLTGAWTGTLGAWILGISKRRTIIAVSLGVIVAGAIVSAVVTLGIEALNLFIKTGVNL